MDEAISFRTGKSFGNDDKMELQNVTIHFEKTLLSIGVGEFHYTTPRGFQGLDPKRERVEIALIDRESGQWATKDFFSEVMGITLHDDVYSVETSEIFSIMHKVSEWEANSLEAWDRWRKHKG